MQSIEDKEPEMDPKKAVAAAVAAALVSSGAVLPGCSIPGFSVTNPIPYERGTIPNERQIQIARDLGVSESVIEEQFLVDGLDSESFDRIMHAEHMLDHLEEKYGETFKPNWIVPPYMNAKNYEMEVTVTSGEHEGSKCRVEYYWKDIEEPYYKDSYFYVLKYKEYEDYLAELVSDVYGDASSSGLAVEIGTSSSTFGDEYSPDTDVRQHGLSLAGHVRIFFPPSCDLTEEEYYALHEEFLDHFAENGVDVIYTIMVITKVREKDEGKPFTADIAWLANRENTEENPTYKWEISSHVSTERSIQL